jgi:hypothetical protein
VPFSGLSGSLYFGNDVTAGQPGDTAFGGWMDTLAIFDAALPQATLQSFVTTLPFIFDEHISALYAGAGGDIKKDLMSGSVLSFIGDAGVKLAENTTFLPTIPVFTFTIKDSSQLTPYYKWEAAVFCNILAQNAADSYGLQPRYEIGGGKYPSAMLAYVSSVILSNPSAQNIVANRTDLATPKLGSACDAIESVSGFSTFFKSLFTGLAIGATAIGMYYYARMKAQTVFAMTAAILFMGILATIITKIVPSPPDKLSDEEPPVIPWPPYDPPKPRYQRRLSLKAITFNHGTRGSTSVNIRSAEKTGCGSGMDCG